MIALFLGSSLINVCELCLFFCVSTALEFHGSTLRQDQSMQFNPLLARNLVKPVWLHVTCDDTDARIMI